MAKSKINQVRAGAIVSYILIFFNIISGFIYTPWLMRQLGDSDYALYTLVTSVMTYFVLDFGIGASITRFVAKYRAEEKDDEIKNLLGITTRLYLILDCIVLIALFAMYFLLEHIYVNLTQVEITRFKTIFVIAGFMSVFSFPFLPQNGVYTAYERLYVQKLFDLIAKILTVSLIVLALLFGGGLYIVVLLNAVITLSMHLIKFMYITKAEKLKINLKHKDNALLKAIFSFSIWVMLATIADRFFFTFIPSLLGIVSNTTEIAIFAVAVSIENYICLFGSAFSNLYLPQVTKMVISKVSPQKITDLMIKVGRIQLLIVSSCTIVIIGMGDEFIRCWVGESKTEAYLALIFILVPSLVHFTQAIGTEMIYATNNVKYRALVYSVGSAISILATVLLAPKYGAIGAGIGIGLALTISHVVLMNCIYKFKLKLDVVRYFRECHLSMLLPMIISCAIAYIIKIIYPVNTLSLFIIKAGVWALLHLPIMWFLMMNNYERGLVKELINKITSKIKRQHL